MKTKPGLTQVYLNPGDHSYPKDRWCKSGHFAEEFLVISGKVKSMRFVKVSGPALDPMYHGMYCEQCLIDANKLARSQKQS